MMDFHSSRRKPWPRLPFNGAPLGVLILARQGSDNHPFIPGDTGNEYVEFPRALQGGSWP